MGEYFPSARAEGRAGPEAVQLSLPPPILGGLSSFLEQAGREEPWDGLTQGLSVYSFEMVLEPPKSGPVLCLPFWDWFVSLQVCPSRILCQN